MSDPFTIYGTAYVDSAFMEKLILVNTIGMAILHHSLRTASYVFTDTTGPLSNSKKKHLKEAKEAYAFVCGTGLDIMLDYYCLDYDPDTLRENFNNMFRRK